MYVLTFVIPFLALQGPTVKMANVFLLTVIAIWIASVHLAKSAQTVDARISAISSTVPPVMPAVMANASLLEFAIMITSAPLIKSA